MDPFAFLRSKDEQERSLMLAIALGVNEIRESDDLARANMIANAVGKMLGG